MGDLPRYRERDSRFLRNLTGQHPNWTTHSNEYPTGQRQERQIRIPKKIKKNKKCIFLKKR